MGKNVAAIQALQVKIAKLQKAKTNLQKGQTKFKTIINKTNTVYTSISNNEWRGERKNKLTNEYDQFQQSSQHDYSVCQQNISLIDGKIQELQAECARLAVAN